MVDDVEGYVNYSLHPFFGLIEKTIVFPFPEYYIAVVYFLENSYAPNEDVIIDELNQGTYPEEEECYLFIIDTLAASLRFDEQQFPD